MGTQTRLPSLELGLEDTRMVGLCDAKYSCAYTSSISWRTPTMPLPPLTNPRHVFERLFGNADPNVDRATAARPCALPPEHPRWRRRADARAQRQRRPRRPPQDRGIPDVDPRGRSEHPALRASVAQRAARTSIAPSGIPADYAEHARLMFDLQALAFQADLTRISTMMIGRESSIRSYDQIGIPESHHQLSHHRNDPATLAKLTRIQTYHMTLFAEFIAKLRRHARRRRLAARSLHDRLRRRHRRQQSPHARTPARPRRRQGQRPAQHGPARRFAERTRR